VEPNQPYTQKDVDVWNATHTLKADFIKKNEENKDKEDKNKNN
jgi:hypothetical protein